MLRHKMRKLATAALVLALTAGAVYGCGLKEMLKAEEDSPSTQATTIPPTLPSEPTQGSEPIQGSKPTLPSEPAAPQPVEYGLTGLWFWLDSSYQAGNSGESFANYHSQSIHVSVSWESMPADCADGVSYIQRFLAQGQWASTAAGQANGVSYGVCVTSQGRYLVLGVYPCNGMLGKIVAEGTGVPEQELIDIVTSGRVEPNQVPERDPNGLQLVEFGGLRLQISNRFAVTQEPDNVFCSDGSTFIMLCYDSLNSYPDCETAEEVAAHNAEKYQTVWETVATDGSTIVMDDSSGGTRIVVYYLQNQTLWEVSATGTFTPDGLAEMCQLLNSALIVEN